jgi:hypothetical protein
MWAGFNFLWLGTVHPFLVSQVISSLKISRTKFCFYFLFSSCLANPTLLGLVPLRILSDDYKLYNVWWKALGFLTTLLKEQLLYREASYVVHMLSNELGR